MRAIQLFATMLFFSSVGIASHVAEASPIQKPSFSISLPNGWVEIPQDVLAAAASELKLKAPNSTIQKFAYGFQPKTSDWMESPYILVQVNSEGRLPEHVFKSTATLDMNEKTKSQLVDLRSVVSNATFGKIYYDDATHIGWVRAETDVVHVGKVQGLSAFIPTEKGFITINAYATEATFNEYLPLFLETIKSVAVAPELAYKTSWKDRSPLLATINWDKVLGKAIVGGIWGLLLGFVGYVVSTRRPNTKGPTTAVTGKNEASSPLADEARGVECVNSALVEASVDSGAGHREAGANAAERVAGLEIAEVRVELSQQNVQLPSTAKTAEESTVPKGRERTSAINPFLRKSEGARRISIVLATLSVIAWFTFIGVVTKGFDGIPPPGWAFLFAAPFGAYLCVMALRLVTLWIVAGFRNTPPEPREKVRYSLVLVAVLPVVAAATYIAMSPDEKKPEQTERRAAAPSSNRLPATGQYEVYTGEVIPLDKSRSNYFNQFDAVKPNSRPRPAQQR